MKKIKFISIFLIIMFCISGFSNVKAAELKTKLDIIQKSADTKYLENDQGYISKSIIDSNKDTGEVTVELKLSNTKKEVEQVTYDSTELIFVIDNSVSMKETVEETKTRRDMVISSAKEFTSKLFKDVNNLKVGVVYYYGYDVKDDGDTPEQAYGSIDTAKILVNLTNKENEVQDSLNSLSTMSYNYGTNTDAGLQKAKSMFSTNKKAQKFVILLSDGVPNHAIGVSTTYGGWLGPTAEQNQNSVNSKTKATIQSINNLNINLITILAGLKDLNDNEKEILNNVFGTVEKPTTGSLYNISDADISTIIKDKIYTEVLEKVQNPINNVKIIDYFPDDITDNFEFSYVETPSKGTVSDSIESQTNTIEWNMETLKGDEVAILKYKLKIKDMKNDQLLNKTIATNEKVVLTYKDTESKDYTVTLSSSPKIQLSEVKEELTATVTYSPNTETNGQVIATITTNKRVKKVEGWTLSSDGKSLTKAYTANTTETVHLEDEDGMTKDVLVKVTNIIDRTQKPTSEPKDDTIATGKLPQTGTGIALGVTISLISLIGCIGLIKYKSYGKLK